MSGRRKESRWGKTVSDEDAMRALLSSAEQRSREREGRNSNDDRRRNRTQRGDRDSRNFQQRRDNYNHERKRRRFVDDDRGKPHRVEDDGGGDDKKEETNTTEKAQPPEFKPNFGLSGALAKDTQSGNMYKGVLLKFKEPPEARAPNTQWRLYVFKPQKDDKKSNLIETLHISKQSAYLFGRNTDIADVPLLHPSLSSQHAVLQYRAVPVPAAVVGEAPRLSCKPYILDLESTNGTFLNRVRVDAARYYELKKGDVLTFGASTREYVLMTENTTSVG